MIVTDYSGRIRVGPSILYFRTVTWFGVPHLARTHCEAKRLFVKAIDEQRQTGKE